MKINNFLTLILLSLISSKFEAKRTLSERVITKHGKKKRMNGQFDITNPNKVEMFTNFQDMSK